MPDSPIPSVGANRLERTLENFKQWSDFSAGYPSTSELLNSCALDETGKVSNPTKVTELTGETWVCAAKIYLQCRYFRFVLPPRPGPPSSTRRSYHQTEIEQD